MRELAVVAGVAAVGVERVVVEAADEDGEVLVLDHGGSGGCEAALLQVGEHVEQVDRGDELHHRVPEELQPLVYLAPVHNSEISRRFVDSSFKP